MFEYFGNQSVEYGVTLYEGNTMNHINVHRPQTTFSLGDLIAAVSSVAKNDRLTAIAVKDLFQSGQVRFTQERRPMRHQR